jgi:predicted Na+-dependent transporter
VGAAFEACAQAGLLAVIIATVEAAMANLVVTRFCVIIIPVLCNIPSATQIGILLFLALPAGPQSRQRRR